MYGQLEENGFIWMDGKLVPWKEANIHVLTHGLHYGTSVFEGVRAYHTPKGPALFRLEEHTQRLLNSARIVDMPIRYTFSELVAGQCEIIRANRLKSAYMRPLLFYGAEHLGIDLRNLSTHVMIAAWEWGAYLGQDAITQGIRVRTSSLTRHHINITFTKAKVSGNYVNSCMALKEAQAAGCQEALMLDPQGHVAEGSAENVFIIRDKIIYTPMLTSCLAGITRDSIMTIARDLGYEVQEKLITRDEVYIADEVFFTGTAVEVAPIVELDARKIGTGKPGPITQQLQQVYYNAVNGLDPKYEKWLTVVE